jgi:hypothetical protein
MKARAIVFGNCQAKALEHVLSAYTPFARRFTTTAFPPVHEIQPDTIAKVHASAERCDLLVVQRISEGYRGLGVGTNTLISLARRATCVRWPDAYWSGYFPDQFYLRDSHGKAVVNGPFDYHDRAILNAFASGLGVNQTVERLADSEQPLRAEEWTALATESLRTRELECDATISAFVASNFDRGLLFFTINHPTNIVLRQYGAAGPRARRPSQDAARA